MQIEIITKAVLIFITVSLSILLMQLVNVAIFRMAVLLVMIVFIQRIIAPKNFDRKDVPPINTYQGDKDDEENLDNHTVKKKRHYGWSNKMDPNKLGPQFDKEGNLMGCVHAFEGVKECPDCHYYGSCKYR